MRQQWPLLDTVGGPFVCLFFSSHFEQQFSENVAFGIDFFMSLSAKSDQRKLVGDRSLVQDPDVVSAI